MKLLPRKWVRRVLALVALAVAGWLGSSFTVAWKLTHRAEPIEPEPLPAVAWGTPEEVRLPTSDGETLGAWFFPGKSDRVAVVLLHGNGERRTLCLPQAELLARDGHPVISVTVRAHGDSTGTRNDIGYSARHDAVAAVGWLHGRL
ncbi:MAG: alpha/beta hydrolase, partial [Gemmataceae bacterium]|nr:alpha/beta hydrolase [Gemmataceae bacterium]